MRLAIQTPPEHTSYQRLVDLWQAADELGFAAAFTFDHFVPLNPGAGPARPGGVPDGPQLEGWMTLAALASRTQRLEVGTLVTGVTYRNPVLLLKQAVTLDHITSGRAILGVGAAWHQAEHTMYGFDFPPVGRRMAMLEETLVALRELEGADSPVTRDGEFVALDQAVWDPRAVRPGGLRVMVGGGGERLRRIAARHADIYNGFWAPWEWSKVNAGLDEQLARAGREPSDLERTAFVFAELSEDPSSADALVGHFQNQRGGTDDEVRARILVGAPDAKAAVLNSYAAAGVEMVIINVRPNQTVDDLRRFAETVLPQVS